MYDTSENIYKEKDRRIWTLLKNMDEKFNLFLS